MDIECKICKNIYQSNRKNSCICDECRFKEHTLICKGCVSELLTTPYHFIRRKDTYECKSCINKGERNNNFNKKWDDEKKKKQSDLIKSKVDDEYRKKAGTGMKGKGWKPESIEKRILTLKKMKDDGYVRPKISDETRLKIGIKSKEKFNKEYLDKVRKMNEENGNWIPIEVKPDYIFYRGISNWVGQVITENIINYNLLKTNKLYDKERNSDNLVRDHMYSRRNGFDNGVYPEIIRHPANCQLISHRDNILKSKKIDDSVISLDELFNRIRGYELPYFDQENCLSLIDKYLGGGRYDKDNYKDFLYS